MNLNDMDFFHQATMRICGSLDIDTVLSDCLAFFKKYLPVNSINMNIHDQKTHAIQNIAIVAEPGFEYSELNKPVKLDQLAINFINTQIEAPVQIVNYPEVHPVGRLISNAMGKPEASFLVLHLNVEGEKLGVIGLTVKGFNRYNKEHARLFSLLHDPFAVALSNTLKHQEVTRLKDLLADDNRYLNQELHHIAGDEIVGHDFGLKDVMEMVRQVAPLSSQVLLLGETGVGKEVIANALHYSSARAGGPFIKVNCGAIPESLIDSELFGHEKGAFTGALDKKRGRFERADKGTIFLDEIGELPQHAQIRLLRVIQTREIERVGGTAPVPVDIRIIAATHRKLEEMVQTGQFREDLWFRLNVFPITIPPLRHRTADISALVNYFIDRKSKEMNLRIRQIPAPGSIEQLQSCHWPGNVRELENVVERALIRNAASPPGTYLYFDEPVAGTDRMELPVDKLPRPHMLTIDDAMKQHIKSALKMADGRVQGEKGAAEILGINASTLRNRMRKLGIPFGRKT